MRKLHFIAVSLQLMLLVTLYGQTRFFDYVYFDDTAYVLENTFVRLGLTFESIQWAFTTFFMGNWHPLSWLSHMLDVSLFGVDPGWAHLHNTLLHGINSFLVYVFLLRISQSWWKSVFLSTIFLVHPLHVESVAWIAERKDLVCALFFLLGLIQYHHYRTSPTAIRAIGLTVVFALALLAKPMAVTFPAVLVLLDVFVYRDQLKPSIASMRNWIRFCTKSIMEKMPLVLLSAGMCVITVIAQSESSTVVALEITPVTERPLNAYLGYVVYLWQMFVPLKLAAFYPLGYPVPTATLLLSSFALLIWLGASLRYTVKYPLLGLGFFWFIVTLLPVIGLVQVGSQAHADRYMYLPSIGILLSLVHVLPKARSRSFAVSASLCAIPIFFLSVICYWQIGYWENRHVLYSRILHVVGPNWQVHINLGADYLQRGMLTEAGEHAQAAFDLQPNRAQSHQLLGDIALTGGDYARAEETFLSGIRQGHTTVEMFNNLGMAMLQQGKFTSAREAFEIAYALEPESIVAKANIERARIAELETNH